MYKVFDQKETIKVPKGEWKDFKKNYKIIEAAGGLVRNEKKEILFIFRKGKWDLPKGKIDKNEKVKSAAKREVKEECGIKGLKITDELATTYHIYELYGKQILKKTYWFKMTTDFKGILTPQMEEDITDVKWIKKKDVPEVLKNTYPAIVEVCKSAGII